MAPSSQTRPAAGGWGQRIRHHLGSIFGNSPDGPGSNTGLDSSPRNMDVNVGGNTNSGQNGEQVIGSVEVALNGGLPSSNTRTRIGSNTNDGGKQTVGDVIVTLVNSGSWGHSANKTMPSAPLIDGTHSDTGPSNSPKDIYIDDRPNQNLDKNGDQEVSSPVFNLSAASAKTLKLDAKTGGNINQGKKQTVGGLQFIVRD